MLRKFLFLLVFLLASWPSLGALPVADGEGRELPSLAPLMERVTPAVVNIATYTHRRISNPLLEDPFFRRFFNLPPQRHRQQRRSQSAGSGVIIDAEQGLVVTNHHVIDNADEIQVALTDGRELKAKLVGSDPEVDLALLQVEADNLVALPLADSDRLRVGDFVVAVGNPFGLGQTVTTGIVSALGRSGLGIEGYENFIQTDASINPGNSGGALINLAGELVGINTAILAPGGGNVGIGFAIPSNMTATITGHLARDGRVNRGKLGVVFQDLSPQLAEAFGLASGDGVLISQVVADSPADRAGIEPGDIVVSLNHKAVRKAAELRTLLGILSVGEEVRLELLRDGERLERRARIAALANSGDGGRYHANLQGATLAEDNEGVVITEIAPNTPAAFAGLRGGDRILSVNRIQVDNLITLQQAAATRRSGILLLIDRQGSALYLALSN